MKVSSCRFLTKLAVWCALLTACVGVLLVLPLSAHAVENDAGGRDILQDSEGQDYFFDGALSPAGLGYYDENTTGVEVCGVTAGSVSFDTESKTLTLDNATVTGGVYAHEGITVALIGDNSADIARWDRLGNRDRASAITVQGSGLLSGSVYCNSFELKSGTVSGSVDSENFVLDSGSMSITPDGTTLTFDSASFSFGYYYDEGHFYQLNQSVKTVVLQGTNTGTLYCQSITVSGTGSLNGGVYCGESYDNKSRETIYKGSFALKSGTINGNVYCGDASISGGSLKMSDDGWRSVYSDGSFTMSGGSIKGDVSCEKNASISRGTIAGDLWCGGTFTMKGGTIESASCKTGTVSGGTIKGGYDDEDGYYTRAISCEKALTISGGTLKSSVRCGTLIMRGGTVAGVLSCDSATISGGTVQGKLRKDDDYDAPINCNKTLKVTGGTVNGRVNCENAIIGGGTVNIVGGYTAFDCNKNFTMTKGKIVIKNPDYGMRVGESNHVTYNFKMSGGTIAIYNPSHEGIDVYSGNFKMTGGMIVISKSYGGGLDVSSDTYRGKTYGGKASITGGTVSITNRKSKDGYYGTAIYASSFSNKAKCLKSIKGRVPVGAKFLVKGNEYLYKYDDWYGCALLKYGAKSKKAKISTVKFGCNKYEVRSIAPKAFNTKRGKKVTSIEVGKQIQKIKTNTFKGARALKAVTFKAYDIVLYKKAFSGNTRLKSVVFKNYVKSLGSNAFSGAKTLKEITFKEGVGNIKDKALAGLKRLSKITFRSGVRTIGSYVFKGAKSLKELTIKGSVTTVKSNAFAGAKALKELTIRGDITNIKAKAFANTKALKKLRVNWFGINENWSRTGKFKGLKLSKDVKMSKKAFAKCGKSRGKGLTLQIGEYGVSKERVKQYKKFLKKRGLPSGVKLKTSQW